jgi:hypothetical protein
LDRAAASRSLHFPVDGEYLLKVRLQRQYQDYLKGMGWPQQLDVRLDGKLLKRFTVGGDAKGGPAALSYAGDGEPGFAGDPEWETYMQDGGDAGLEVRSAGRPARAPSACRSCASCGSRKGFRIRRSAADDRQRQRSTWDYANVGSVQIGGPYRRRAGAGHAEPSRDLRLQPRREADERACATILRGSPRARIAGR